MANEITNEITRPWKNLITFNAYQAKICSKEGVTNELAKKRILGGGKNSLSWVLGHMAWDRNQMIKSLGLESQYEWDDLFKSGSSCTEGENYPDIDVIRDKYDELTQTVLDFLEKVSEEDITKPLEKGFPHQDKNPLGAVVFWTWQDAYHLGQIGSIRTLLGLMPLRELYHESVKATA